MEKVKAVVSRLAELLVVFDEMHRVRYTLKQYSCHRPISTILLADIVDAFDSIEMVNVSKDISARVDVFERMLIRAYHGYSTRDVRRYWLKLRTYIEFIIFGINRLLGTLPVDSKNTVLYSKERGFIVTKHLSECGQLHVTLRCGLTGYPMHEYTYQLSKQTYQDFRIAAVSLMLPAGTHTMEQY